MNINYNENDHAIEIKDTFKTQYWITNISLIFGIINCIIFPVFILERKQMEWFGFIWIILGLVFLIGIIHQILTLSTSDHLKLSEIHSVKEKQFLGQKKISLKLKNGKTRDLIDVKTEAETKAMKVFFKNLGIEMT